MSSGEGQDPIEQEREDMGILAMTGSGLQSSQGEGFKSWGRVGSGVKKKTAGSRLHGNERVRLVTWVCWDPCSFQCINTS